MWMKLHWSSFLVIFLLLTPGIAVSSHGPEEFWFRMGFYLNLDETGKLGPFSVKVSSYGNKPELPRAEQVKSRKFNKYLSDKFNVAAVVTEAGEIIYERYDRKKKIDLNSQLFAASFAKTAVSTVVGGLLCDGRIKSLDDPASKYSEFLSSTQFGDITIRNLLQMSSGVSMGRNIDEKRINQQTRGMRRYQGKGSARKALASFRGKAVAQGTRFEYHAADTLALAVLAEDIAASSLSKTFYESHFRKFSPTSHMHWLSDQDGTPAAFSDLTMSARDWSAFGNYLLAEMKSGSCLGNFFQQGIDQSVATGRDRIRYGFQSWVYEVNGDPVLVMRGHGGQFNVIMPNHDKVLTIISIDENYKFGNLFSVIGELAEKVL